MFPEIGKPAATSQQGDVDASLTQPSGIETALDTRAIDEYLVKAA